MLTRLRSLVSIEPDSRVWSAFETNRRTHRCMSWFVRGTASAADSGDLVVIPGAPQGASPLS